jgi:hypothetical protein
MIRHETSRECVQNASTVGSTQAGPQAAVDERSTAPTTADDALHLAILLAVDARDCERAAALIEVAKRPRQRSLT